VEVRWWPSWFDELTMRATKEAAPQTHPCGELVEPWGHTLLLGAACYTATAVSGIPAMSSSIENTLPACGSLASASAESVLLAEVM